MEKRLVFIYDATSDFVSAAKDTAKKILTGKSGCSLCTAAWGVFDKKKYWSDQEKKIKIPYQYLHRDQLSADIQSYLNQHNILLPTVLLGEGNNFRELVTKHQLDKCEGNEACVWNLLKAEKSIPLNE